jgi:hypothetical protein
MDKIILTFPSGNEQTSLCISVPLLLFLLVLAFSRQREAFTFELSVRVTCRFLLSFVALQRSAFSPENVLSVLEDGSLS